MDCLSFPIKFESNGISKLEDGSYDFFKQLLTIALLTEPGENPITPEFGVIDPSFNPVEPADFIITAAKFVPEIEITSISSNIDKETSSIFAEFSFRIVG